MRSGTLAVIDAAASSLIRSASAQEEPLNLRVGPHDVRRVARLYEEVLVGDGDDLHAGGQARRDPGLGILDHAALPGSHVEQLSRAEEDVRCRLEIGRAQV